MLPAQVLPLLNVVDLFLLRFPAAAEGRKVYGRSTTALHPGTNRAPNEWLQQRAPAGPRRPAAAGAHAVDCLLASDRCWCAAGANQLPPLLPLRPSAAPAPCPCVKLEAAQGGVDSEARSKMDLLRQQLGALDQARQRAVVAEAELHASSLDAGCAGLQTGMTRNVDGGMAGNAAAMLQQMEG